MARTLVPDDLWAAFAPPLPPPRPKPKGGRSSIPDRRVLAGSPWARPPAEMGCGSGVSCWRRLRDGPAAGVWAALHRLLLERLRGVGQIDWRRAALRGPGVAAT